MTGQELYEDVRRWAGDLGVRVWIAMDPSTAPDGEPYGQAGLDDDGVETVWLTHPPDTEDAYLVALHELGHHVAGRPRSVKRGEARAWRWAIEHSLVPDWACTVAHYLGSYDLPRWKDDEEFTALLGTSRAICTQPSKAGV